MNDCKIFREMLVDAAMGDLSSDEEKLLQRHVSTCAECRALLREQEDAIAIYAQFAYEAPPESYWDGYVRRLRSKMAPSIEGEPSRVAHLRIVAGAWPLRIAMTALVFAIGFIVGRATIDREGHRADVPSVSTSGVADAFVAQFLTRTQALFLGLANTQSPHADGLVTAAHRQAAQLLLRDSRILQDAVDERIHPTLFGLIEDIHPVLLQTANSDAQDDTSAGATIKGHGLLLRINLYLMDHQSSSRTANL